MSGRRYLRIVRMDAFGAFSGKTVGPFGPCLLYTSTLPTKLEV